MASDTEQALVEAMASVLEEWFVKETGEDPSEAQRTQMRRDSSDQLAALRAALPEGVVLTRDGLAKVEQRAWVSEHGLPHHISFPTDTPLYTLTLENET